MLGITAVRTRGTFLRRTVRKYFLRTNTFKKYVLITQKNNNETKPINTTFKEFDSALLSIKG